MEPRPIRHRRARRTDMAPIHAVLAEAADVTGPDDRAARSRFRRVVADLGADLYVATIDDRVVGVLHLTYARHLLEGQRATLELLVVRPAARRRGVGTALAALACARAGARQCRALTLGADHHLEAGGEAFLARLGWRAGGERWQVALGSRRPSSSHLETAEGGAGACHPAAEAGEKA